MREILERNSVKSALNKIAKEENFEDYEIIISPGSKRGDNHGGDVYKIIIKNNNRKLHLFLKIAREADREISKLCEYFEREELFYLDILPKLLNFQNEKNITEKFKSIPKCYGTCSLEYSEYIIMNDLSVDGFMLRDQLVPVDLDHCQFVMKELGKLHALSFALNDQHPELMAEYKNKLPELNFKNPLPAPYEDFLLYFVNYAKSHLQIESQYQKQWNNFIDNYILNAQNCCNGELAEPYRVISHGDVWTNNILFKYENGKPMEIRLLDFQFIRYCSPVMDVVQFIFTITHKSLRDVHYEDLINLYYNTLADYLKELGSDAKKLFPYSAFQHHLKQFGKFGLCIAILGSETEAMRKPEDFTPISRNKEESIQRINEVVNDMGRLGYL